jgi:uridine kinase
MPRHVSRAEAVDAVADLAARTPDRSAFVGIDGFGGSGKSSLAAAIATAVARVSVVSIDDFSGPRVAEWDWARFRAQVLIPLLAGRPARYQVWDWDRDTGAAWSEVPAGRVVVVEGVSSTRSEVDAPWDLTIWVDAPRETRLRRALERDGEAMRHRWLDDWVPSEEAYAARENPRERVDLIVNGVSGEWHPLVRVRDP